MTYVLDYRDHTGKEPEKYYKTTLFRSGRLLLGLNCLEPGQVQGTHEHDDQDKFYFVVEGRGTFALGEETYEVGPGHTVWAPAGLQHGVTNTGDHTLVLLVGIAPAPK